MTHPGRSPRLAVLRLKCLNTAEPLGASKKGRPPVGSSSLRLDNSYPGTIPRKKDQPFAHATGPIVAAESLRYSWDGRECCSRFTNDLLCTCVGA